MVAAGVERIGHQHRIVDRRDLDAALREDVPVEFGVMGDLEDARRLQQRLQQAERLALGESGPGRRLGAAEKIALPRGAMAERDIAGAAGRDAKREADEIGLHRIERTRLGVEGDKAGLEGLVDPALQFLARRRPST